MAKVQHYSGLDTDLDNLHNSIKAEIENENNLQIASEYKGEMNGKTRYDPILPPTNHNCIFQCNQSAKASLNPRDQLSG